MKSAENISIAVVIPTLNREKVLTDTISSVLKLNPPPDEILIMDQTLHHERDTEEYLRKITDFGVRIIRLPEPGVCFARNLGAALANTDVVIYLDDDVLIKDPAFIDMHRKNYSDPAIDAVLGQILEAGREKPGMGLSSDIPWIKFASRWENIESFVTANVSIRRNVLLRTGGFDEGFSGRTYANEDGDLGLRLSRSGYRIVFDPSACLLHLWAPSGGNRITGRDVFPEWTRSVTFFQFALRHYSGWLRIWKILGVFRLIPLRKENVHKPWCLPGALAHAFYALNVAMQRHKIGFRSSLYNPGVDCLRQKFADVNGK